MRFARLPVLVGTLLATYSALPLHTQQPATPPSAPGTTPTAAASPAAARRPRPYAQVVTDKAITDVGGITVHRVDERWLLEVPDSLAGRDFLLITRVAGVPSGFDGFVSAGSSVEDRLVRFERTGDRLLLRTLSQAAYAADSLPIARSVAVNNLGAILAAFPVAAYGRANGRDSATAVVDVTDFFSGDTPALSGLTAEQRRRYQVRRLDPARSFIASMRTFPLNVEVRHAQTFDAAEPPGDRGSSTLTLEMRQSLVLLPKTPMRGRFADQRAGFFSVTRVNYGLDEQKAAEESFIRRWRLEPKDTAAYLRGELVEPITPITYYLDPGTPQKWRRYVKQGVEDWQKVFEKAGFTRAIIAKDAPTPAEDPEWDPEDVRYSVVRWAASTVRNAVGPSTSDPRTGEIIESDITWYHNHMRSYRNRLMLETGAANPAARTLDIPEQVMGETMRQVIAHEVGHAIGLPHNMVASSSFPVDSLRSPSFVRTYGVSATIMDYARQNYVAQPGDGLEPLDFIRRLGPFDDFIIDWGYRAYPTIATPEAERTTLRRRLAEQSGPLAYRYVPQQFGGADPRSQTEDLGDDPIKASTYALANLRRVVPNLANWTARAGEDYEDLAELHGEAIRMYGLYMGHVVNLVGGVEVDFKTTDQAGPVYRVVPRARQAGAVRFLEQQLFTTPTWLAPPEIMARVGPTATTPLAIQSGVFLQLLDVRRLGRMAESTTLDPAAAYPVAAYLQDLRTALWGGAGALPDANRRALQRVHVERLDALLNPAPAPAGAAGAGAPPTVPPLLALPNVPRSDLPALARAEARAIRLLATTRARTASPGVMQAHWNDVVARVDDLLEPKPGR